MPGARSFAVELQQQQKAVTKGQGTRKRPFGISFPGSVFQGRQNGSNHVSQCLTQSRAFDGPFAPALSERKLQAPRTSDEAAYTCSRVTRRRLCDGWHL